MIFCLGTDKYESSGEGYQKSYRVFNKQVDKDEWQKIKDNLPEINFPLTHWIEEKEMSTYKDKEIGGYLKTLDYEEAWTKWWEGASKEDKNKITSIKYFDAEIFKGITGIEIGKEISLSGKKVKIKLADNQIVEGEIVEN